MAKRFHDFNQFTQEFLKESLQAETNLSLLEMYNIGNSTTISKVFVLKQSKTNESYNILLESEEMLEAIDMQVASDMIQEGFKDFAKSVFGDKVVARIEQMPKKLYTFSVDLLDKGKEVWDKTVTGFKDFLGKVKDIVKNIIDAMKKFLHKLYDLIQGVATKMGKYVFKEHAEKLEDLVKHFETNEAEEPQTDVVDYNKDNKEEDKGKKKDPAKYVAEMQTVSQEFAAMRDKYFKSEKFDETEKMAIAAADKIGGEGEGEKKAEEPAVNDSIDNVIWKSFVGLYSVSEESDMEEFFNFVNEAEDGGGHKKKSKVVEWAQSIVMWILSPLGALAEYAAGQITKMIMSAPSAILKGVKNATKYVHVPAIATILFGIVADVWGMAGGEGGGAHESFKHIQTFQQLFESDNQLSESLFSHFDKIKGEMGDVAKVGVSAIAGYAISFALHAVPPLHTAFEVLSICAVTIMFFGWLKEQHKDTEWSNNIPKLCVDFYHWIH